MTAHRPAVHQVLATLGYGDAIGHEVIGIQRVLRDAGYASDIFVETADPRVEDLTRDYRELVDASHPDNLLLHHFSIGSKASRTAYAVPDRMALVYHNITPPEFFARVHPQLARQCFRGRRELQAYRDRCEIALGDSAFNREDLVGLGFARTAVLPVIPDLSRLDAPADWFAAAQFDDDWTNILVVGRVISNKCVEDAIRAFHVYHTRHNPRSRLIIAGIFSVFERYFASLTDLTRALGLAHVHFTGHISDAEVIAYYECADLLLCMSEHEGFCVPLIEAFYKQVPVVAYAATAVPATMDGAGVLVTTKDPGHIAQVMDAVLSDPALQDAIADAQDAAVARLQAQDFDHILLQHVESALRAPRIGHPHVAFDFWAQFDAFEALEEVRRYRPSAYAALPEAPA